MMNLIGNLIKKNVDISDEIIATSMLGAGKEAAELYLNSTLTSTTPVLRGVYSAALGQIVEGHTALTELSVNKGWIKPYNTHIQQLTCAYEEAEKIIKKD